MLHGILLYGNEILGHRHDRISNNYLWVPSMWHEFPPSVTS